MENFPRKERGIHISRADNENDIDRVANSTLPPKIENFQARSRTKENGADIENMARSRVPVANVSQAAFPCELRRGRMHKRVSCVE